MSLIKCPECKKKISNQAITCPHCGRPIPPPQLSESKREKGRKKTGWFIVILIFGILIFIVVFSSNQSGEKKEQSNITIKLADPPSKPQKTEEEKEKLKTLAEAKAHMDLDRYITEIDAIQKKLGFMLIEKVSVSGNTATVTVTNIWHNRNYQLRLQDAQTFWEIWASINNPDDPDKAILKLVDYNGNKVGGSSWAGSIIKVQKY